MDSSALRKTTAVIVGLAIVVPLILLMFIGPASRSAPRDIAIGVAGPAAAVAQVQESLAQRQPGAFAVHAYDDAAALEQAARDREVYGGLVLGPQPVTVIATGASPVVAGVITQLGATLGATQPDAQAPTVVDVAPASESDPRGAGFGSVIMPIFLAGAVLGIALTQLLRRVRLIAVALPIGAAVVGAASVGVAMWAGVLTGGFWAQWLAMTAGIYAIGAVIAGLASLVGLAGMGLAALVFMLIGMPVAGIATPPEYLPGVWGHVGQALPLGAAGTALRAAAFFGDGRMVGIGGGAALLVLLAWIAVGYVLLGLTVLKRRKLVREHLEPEPEPASRAPAITAA